MGSPRVRRLVAAAAAAGAIVLAGAAPAASSWWSPPPGPADAWAWRGVPNVVGLDHQLAQDLLQDAGFYRLDEVDATGQGRLLLWDRNWTVVAQEPSAGAVVSPDTVVLLRSVRDREAPFGG